MMSWVSTITSLVLLSFISNAHGVETITGIIYCDNYFEFYFNGELVKKDPMTFTPHNAVAVSFEWDGVSNKHYAILCQDYASESGYEYTDTNRPQLGDGALIAEFSDGTVTSSEWKLFVASYGPTEESENAGCNGDNLNLCVVEDVGNPVDWAGADFDYSDWEDATVYTANEAGWGRAPSWQGDSVGCCTATSPIDRSTLSLNNGCSVNYDSATGQEVMATVSESECLSPRDEFSDTDAEFLWGADLDKDNRVLFRYSVILTPTVDDSSSSDIMYSGNSTNMTTTDDFEMEEEDEPSLSITINGQSQGVGKSGDSTTEGDSKPSTGAADEPELASSSSSSFPGCLRALAFGVAWMVATLFWQ